MNIFLKMLNGLHECVIWFSMFTFDMNRIRIPHTKAKLRILTADLIANLSVIEILFRIPHGLNVFFLLFYIR